MGVFRFILLTTITGLAFVGGVSAQKQKQDIDFHLDFREANTLLGEQSDYQAALEKYLSIADSRGLSENLALNIATCYFKTDQMGYARLYLERALLINPHNPDARNNLKVIRKALNLEEPEPTALETIASKLNSNTWFVMGCAVVFTPFMFLFLKRVFQSFKATNPRISGGFWVTTLATCIVGTGIVYLAWLNASLSKCGIVTAQETTLRQSPFEQADISATVSEGRKIRISKSHSDFYLCIEKAEGIKGWISKKDFEPIIPEE